MALRASPEVAALRAAAGEASRRADALGRPVLLEASWPTDADRLSRRLAASSEEVRVYWRAPAGAVELLGLGRVVALRAAGEQRARQLVDDARAATADAVRAGQPPSWATPRWLGGLAFDPEPAHEAGWRGFAPGMLIRPRLLVARRGSAAWLTAATLAAPGDASDVLVGRLLRTCGRLPAPAADARSLREPLREPAADARGRWRRGVAQVLADIERGAVDKVVLARARTLRLPTASMPVWLLDRLAVTHDDCTLLWFQPGSGAALVAATPETLVRLSRGRVTTAGLAGTAPRGPTPEADAALGAALLACPKERREHRLVVEAIRGSLAPACESLWHADGPSVRTLATLQHLETPFAGRARPGSHALALAAALHPTPAVAGWPTDVARARLAAVEQLDRGWYAGAVGHVDDAGQGRFVVAIRCARVEPSRVRLYAGAGIVAGSQPEREWAETELKLDALGRLLSPAGVGQAARCRS